MWYVKFLADFSPGVMNLSLTINRIIYLQERIAAMNTLYGWTGKLLQVDLTARKCTERNTLDYAERFIGGKGIAAKIYWDSMAPQRDSFHPDSPLIIMTGPLAATPLPAPRAGLWPENPPRSTRRILPARIWAVFSARP